MSKLKKTVMLKVMMIVLTGLFYAKGIFAADTKAYEAYLAKYPDSQNRIAAVRQEASPTQLAEIAVKDEQALVRSAAVEQIADQNLLAKRAVEDSDPDVRFTAFNKLTDQPLLAKIVQGNGVDAVIRQFAAYRIESPDDLPERWDDYHDNPGKILRLRRAGKELEKLKNLKNMKVVVQAKRLGPVYYSGRGVSFSEYGEQVDISVTWSGLKTKSNQEVRESWETDFPRSIETSGGSKDVLLWSADIPMHKYMAKLLSRLSCSENELSFLATQSIVPELRWAAVAGLNAPEIISKIALEDRSSLVRLAAVEKVSDPALLAKIYLEDQDDAIHNLSRERLGIPEDR
ncbi:MAG: hypothetical protein HQL23_03635 [Candidatus Omnitrophica bacterium]|nr:hypothetical protein [Candidatus Omnitrophota bacterium]